MDSEAPPGSGRPLRASEAGRWRFSPEWLNLIGPESAGAEAGPSTTLAFRQHAQADMPPTDSALTNQSVTAESNQVNADPAEKPGRRRNQ